MSQQSRLEKELLTLSSANFQKLCDAYLRRIRGWALQSWGTVAGSDKDKTGVPDAYAQLPDGHYVLVAYTTTAPPKLARKLADDLADCAKEASQHLEADSVERIVLVCNNRISLADYDQLGQQAAKLGYPLQLLGLDDVVAMLLSYPALAAELLPPLDWGRGQLVQGEEFIAIAQRQFAATPFASRLIGRDAEQQTLLQQVAVASLVLVYGSAGVGKTQLVLTACQAYCAEASAYRQLYFVYDKKSADFIRELQFVSEPGKEVVVVADDANRMLPYLVQLLAEQVVHPIGALKIVATVRDYAREAVMKVARQVAYEELEVKPLSDEVMSELLAAEPYGILNQRYLERILELSEGRPRLAIMAALAAKETQQLSRLHNVADIYERYLGPLLEELAARHNQQLIQVLALLHFFRVVRQDDTDLLAQVEIAFGITPNEFWAAAQELYEAEVVEVHEERVVKSSDQTLGNFAFYQVFFGRRPALAYQQLLLMFFEPRQNRVMDTLNGLLNDFDFATIERKIRPALRAWLRQANLDADHRWKFYHTFWPFLPSEALTAAQQLLQALPWPARPARDYAVLPSRERSFVFESPVLAVLKDLAGHPTPELPTVLGLLLELGAKQTDQFGKVLDFFQHGARFEYQQYELYDLDMQQALLDALLAGTQEPEQADFHWWMLAHVLPACLATSFHGIYPKRQPDSVMMAHYELPYEQHIQSWRQRLWQAVFDLFARESDLALQLISQYREQQHDGKASGRWLAWDARLLLPFLAGRLNDTDFTHCQLVHEYCQWLANHARVPEAAAVSEQFTSPRYRLYDQLLYERPYDLYEDEEYALRLLGDERESLLSERLAPLYYTTLPEYEQLLQDYQAVHASGASANEQRQMADSMAIVLAEVLVRDRELGLQVLQALFSTGNTSGLCPQAAIRLLASQDYAAGYALLTASDYRGRSCWQLRYLTHLPAELADTTWLAELQRVFAGDLSVINFNGLDVYTNLTPTLYPDLLAQVLNRADAAVEPIAVQYDFIDRFSSYFGPDHRPLLQRRYRQQAGYYPHFDVKGQYLQVILRQAPDFLLELLGADNRYGTRFERQPLPFLWQLPDAEQLLTRVLADIAAGPDYRRDRLAETFFAKPLDMAEQNLLEAFLTRMLQRPDLPSTQVSVLIYSVKHSLPERLPYFLGLLFQSRSDNPNGLFEQLQFIPSIRTSSSRSSIPQHREDMALWEVILQTIDQQPRLTACLRAYRTHVLRQLESLRRQIDYAAEQDFADPY
ncbi:MAG: hypothetical protein ACRYG7_11705 [Janthinobacterium lividum]